MRTAYVITLIGERGGVGSAEVTKEDWEGLSAALLQREVDPQMGTAFGISTINPAGFAFFQFAPGQMLRFEIRENVP